MRKLLFNTGCNKARNGNLSADKCEIAITNNRRKFQI